MKRVIFHVDVNSAFLSWEAAYRLHHLGGRLDLRLVPSAVGGDQEKRHGIILAKSIPAKKYGIHTGETVLEAKQKCPNLILVPPNYTLYNRSSKALIAILDRFSDRVEQYSIDEAFLDMTGSVSEPVETAHLLKDTVKNELGFTVNVGVASNKLLAKMASDLKKPDRVHTLWENEIQEKLWPLPVRALFYVGHAAEQKLARYGIFTVGELAQTDPHFLEGIMKSQGRLVWQYANGFDRSEVIAEAPPNKGYGNSLTTPRDVCDLDTAKLYLLSLAETISARLREDRARTEVVAVSLRDYNLRFYGHQKKLNSPTDLTVEIYAAACRCLEELWDGIPLRHLGIHASRITRENFRQMELFSGIDYEKQKKAETAVDAIRKRFGKDTVMRACFLAPPGKSQAETIDHMGGGISREKRTVDYTKEKIQ